MQDRSAAWTASLASRSDVALVTQRLWEQRLMQLLGSRILHLAPGFGGDAFAGQVELARRHARGRARGIELLAGHIRERLDARGIRMLPLKGPFLARRLYGDPSLRSTNDLDLLVDAARLDEAVDEIAKLGFEADSEPRDRDDIHRALRHPQRMLPRVEVHWRLHWYEEEFSTAMLDRATVSGEWLVARPDDELAALLLFYARDGFYGLRAPTDLAGWWDRYGGEARDAPVLATHVRDFPQLREALVTAAHVAEALVGVPANAVVPADDAPRRRGRMAARLANWDQAGELDQLAANIALVDALLGSRRQLGAFVRRRVWLPRAEIAAMYELDDPDGLRARAWRVAHVPKLGARFALGLAGFRGVTTPQGAGRRAHQVPA